jgi:hypothetical protein
MREVLHYISMTAELTAAVVGILLMIIIIRRNPKYLGNVFMGLSICFLGVFALTIFIYDAIPEVWAIQLFLPIGICFIVTAGLFMYYTFNILSESTKWFNEKKNWLPSTLLVIGFILYIIIFPVVIIESINPPNTRIEMLPLIIMVVLLLYFLVSVLIKIQNVAIKVKVEPFHSQMRYFRAGIITLIIALFINAITQVFENMGVLDNIFYIVLLIGEIIFAYSFLGFRNNEEKEQNASENE